MPASLPRAAAGLRSIEVFSGAGGLALGTHAAGFRHEVLLEWDKNACETLKANAVEAAIPGIEQWDVTQDDVRTFDFTPYKGVDLVAGGPPCQPFSVGGKHSGSADERNMIPEFARVVRELRPRAFMMENVRGLIRPGFRPYFDYVLLELSRPDVPRFAGESWQEHLIRLQAAPRTRALRYDVRFKVMNAADYGVPQQRQRVFVVGFRSDLHVDYQFPEPTHSLDALTFEQWGSGEYWKRHHVRKPATPADVLIPQRLALNCGPVAWRTVRDAISDLPEPRERDCATVANHRLQPGAKAYHGHTGSDLDFPAKTLKAGDHGVPGGENMLRNADGSVRYFTVREAARIQTFPDGWRFRGAWSEAMRQLGNAVPVRLAETVARSVADALVHA